MNFGYVTHWSGKEYKLDVNCHRNGVILSALEPAPWGHHATAPRINISKWQLIKLLACSLRSLL